VTVKYPQLTAVLDRHTVQTDRGLMAGFLVRCTSSRKELGHVWQAGSAWRWRTPDGQHYGERSTQRAAVQVLRDAHDLAHGAQQRPLPLSGEGAAPEWHPPAELPPMKPAAPPLETKPKRERKPRATPPTPPRVEPPPVKKIVWTPQAPDVTDALAAAIRKHAK